MVDVPRVFLSDSRLVGSKNMTMCKVVILGCNINKYSQGTMCFQKTGDFILEGTNRCPKGSGLPVTPDLYHLSLLRDILISVLVPCCSQKS